MDAELADRLQLEEVQRLSLYDVHRPHAHEDQTDNHAALTLTNPTSSANGKDDDGILAETMQLSLLMNDSPKPKKHSSQPTTADPSPRSATRPPSPAALSAYSDRFPWSHRLLPTPSTNRRCGLYAITLSYASQLPEHRPRPTVDSLIEIVNSDDYRDIVSRPLAPRPAVKSSQDTTHVEQTTISHRPTEDKKWQQVRPKKISRNQRRRLTKSYATSAEPSNTHGDRTICASILKPDRPMKDSAERPESFLSNDRHFSPDQLDLILRLWGENWGLRLRLGYVFEGRPVLSAREEDSSTFEDRGDGVVEEEVVWVHLEGGGLGKGSKDGKRRKKGTGIGHYSGMARR